MFEKRFYYLVKFQFLGYRYHGWQKQPDVKTLHSVIDRTLKYILEDRKFKNLKVVGKKNINVPLSTRVSNLHTEPEKGYSLGSEKILAVVVVLYH